MRLQNPARTQMEEEASLVRNPSAELLGGNSSVLSAPFPDSSFSMGALGSILLLSPSWSFDAVSPI